MGGLGGVGGALGGLGGLGCALGDFRGALGDDLGDVAVGGGWGSGGASGEGASRRRAAYIIII